jgi:hypothetical protein
VFHRGVVRARALGRLARALGVRRACQRCERLLHGLPQAAPDRLVAGSRVAGVFLADGVVVRPQRLGQRRAEPRERVRHQALPRGVRELQPAAVRVVLAFAMPAAVDRLLPRPPAAAARAEG